jgi:WD40 repeat protein/DNA-binding SARP family transcriptional activator
VAVGLRRSVQLRVLGPVDARADGRPLSLGGAKQRAVLAMLGLEANRTVSADHLIEGLWGEHPPASAAKMLQNYVWRLRGLLDADAGAEIVTRGRDYELRIDPGSVDVCRVDWLLREATRAAEAGEPVDAAREALALWRGPALSDVADQPFAASAIRRLDELRLDVAELAIDADLAAGRHHEVAWEISAMVAEQPLRERFHAQRMLALYRCGRQADALEAYRDARRTLVDEIGVEPGPELQDLHDAMLRQDRSLDVEAAAPELPRELDAVSSPSLAGREEELSWLRAHGRRARRGTGALVTLVGAHGMGKSRLAAEIAGEAHRDGATVLYVAGTGSAEAAVAAIARTRESRRPTLLVIDDADRAGVDVLSAIRALGDEPAIPGSLVVATGQEAAALTRLRPSASLTLEPLDADAVRQIGLLYAPAGTAGEMPVDRLRESSRGVARRVHEVASEWARREAARRVDAVAGRAAANRSRARALEAALAGRVVELQSARERMELFAAPESEDLVACPFKGLATFDVADAEYFFGREQLVAELVARLAGAPLLAVVGPSGSGKSSALRAGLLPALAGGVLPGSEGWARVLIRPGGQPMRELNAAESVRGEHGRILLAVDQFEETFTACRDERQRDAFVAALVEAARDREGSSVVVLALRADFYGRCGAYPELSRLIGANTVLVGPMSREELRRAISRPAERVGLRVETDLEDALIAAVDGQPGALPLLSTTLLELWQQRRGRRLQLADYSRTGGVHGAVARLAEDAFGRLEPAEQKAARNVLLRLAGEGEGGAIVRSRVPLAELDAQRNDDVARVVAVFTNRRLLTVSAGTVEVAHEALLREWPRLRGWLDEDSDGRRLHRRLSQAAREWSQGGRDRGDLYRGGRLASAVEWRAEHEPELNATEQQFLDASRAAGERARRRLRLVLAGVFALMMLATGAALLALEQRGRARAEARAVKAQALGAQALDAEQLDRSLLLAHEGVGLNDAPATRDNLLAALRSSPAAIGVMRGDGDPLTSVALHPDGRTLAVGDDDGTLVFLDAVTRRRLGSPQQVRWASRISSLAFSNDGTRLASAGWDKTGTVVDLFDGRTRRRLARVGDFPYAAEGSVHFSPDSRVLAAQDKDPADVASSFVPLWNARTARAIRWTEASFEGDSAVLGFVSSPRRLVTSSDHSIVIRDVATLHPLRRFAAVGSAAALSSAAGLVAFAAQDGSVRLLDVRSGELRTARGRHEAPVLAISFSPGGDRLVTAGRDERLIVWDPKRATALETLEARGIGIVRDLQVARDGRTAYSAGGDGTVIAWDLTGARRWERPFGTVAARGFPASLTTAARGSHFAVIDSRGFVDVFESRSLNLTGRIRPGRGHSAVVLPVDARRADRTRASRKPVTGAALAPDGRTLAITTVDGELEFWDVRSRQRLGDPQSAHANPAWTVSYSADGRWLATGGGDALLRIWDARRRTAAGSVALTSDFQGVSDLSFSPEGTTLAVTRLNDSSTGGLEIRSVPDLKLIRTVAMPTGTVGRFAPDGRTLLYGDRDGRVWTLDTDTWKPRGRPIDASPSILTVDLSPDGRLIATTSTDGSGRLWDVASRRPIGATLSGESGGPIGAAFIHASSRLAVLHERGGVAWDVRPHAWAHHACAVAGRPLTRSEWEAVLPEHDYAPACIPR